jgi:uncharacterized protein Yka (UPF0111/DUF47 family)
MDDQKFQDLILESLEKLTQVNMDIKQNLNELNQRIETIETNIIHIENNLDQKLSALINAQETQIDISQRLLDVLSRSEGKNESAPKGLFS